MGIRRPQGHEGSIPSARGMLRSASFQSRNSVFSVQMAGKRSKEFGADELEAWPSQFLVPKGFAAAKLAEICTVCLHSSYTAKSLHIICN
jgi:hypothetical protein